MAKRNLTDRTLKALKPAPRGKLYDVMDRTTPGLGVRVSDSGRKTFVLVARFPGSANPTRRSVGQYGSMTLATAREQAREWLEQIRAGTDPKIAEARKRQAAEAATSSTFELVAERFIASQLPKQRRGHVVERIIRAEVLPFWKDRPAGEITHRDVRKVITRVVERGAPSYARNVFDAVRATFRYAVNMAGVIDVSPMATLKPSDIIGENKAIRQRVLDDGELRALWGAAGELGYPLGSIVRMLMLTGCRLNEVAGARWREFDLAGRVWTIPPERFKSDAQHIVPLSDDMMTLLEGLPRFRRGDHVFSTTFGEKPVNGFSKAKARIDQRVGAIPGWCFHDIRRTVRTRLSGLVVVEHVVEGRRVQERIPEHVAEMVIGHGRKGLARIYDQHKYISEMREALTLWAARLQDVVEPPPANVVKLEKARG